MPNSLTREVGLKVGPVILEVLVKRWFDCLKKDEDSNPDSGTRLKENDIIYHQSFTIAKAFLNNAIFHTIEELQGFSNTRTPSPPWVHVIREVVPLSCCEEAATYLIKALGGEDVARQLVGGIKWWQVRGIDGVDAQWITAKKDWLEAKKKYKMQYQNPKPVPPFMGSEEDKSFENEGMYDKDMDAMRCILYLHGGGYYFGSVDQTRYSIQRHARKINGRVFAINYRLAPQYPFPCGLHDAIAAYIFLIRPPPGANHVAVNPAHIIISGDSAGGGLSLALLQAIRDSGLPMPAGGVLISPWCDMTHSFPSVQLNAHSDIIPESGLSFHKPSILWPPPSSDVSNRVHASLRFRIKQAFRLDEVGIHHSQTSTITSEQDMPHKAEQGEGKFASRDRETVAVHTESGETIEITDQLHFYTKNSLLIHPLVSPVAGYLGGLPPLLFIAGDDEVLRDEIIYTAHKAAYPEKYLVDERARSLYPSLNGIEQRSKPTSVHLQVYDGTPHILPVLFMFTTPAKYCFRAIARFNKFVTEMKPITPPMAKDSKSSSSTPPSSLSRRKSLFAGFKASSSEPTRPNSTIIADAPLTSSPAEMASEASSSSSPRPEESKWLSRAFSSRLSRASTLLRRRQSLVALPVAAKVVEPAPVESEVASGNEHLLVENLKEISTHENQQTSISPSDVGGPRFQVAPLKMGDRSERTAGEPQVYADIKDHFNWDCRMIRERVSTAGVIRPLEPEEELAACKLRPEYIARFSEKAIQRYLKGRRQFDKKFGHTLKVIEKERRNNLARAKEDTIKRVSVLRQTITKDKFGKGTTEKKKEGVDVDVVKVHGHNDKSKPDALTSPGWAWAWALDDSESPPPSSIVSRRDTEEARKLAAVADWATQDEDSISGNNLWTVVQNFLTATPGKDSYVVNTGKDGNGGAVAEARETQEIKKKGSIFTKIL